MSETFCKVLSSKCNERSKIAWKMKENGESSCLYKDGDIDSSKANESESCPFLLMF